MIESTYQLITFMETNYKDRTALQYYDALHQFVSVTYGQYVYDIRRCVNWLQETISDVAGCHIGILARNSYEYAVFILAGLAAGAVVVPLNSAQSVKELQYELELAEIEALFYDTDSCSIARDLIGQYTGKCYALNAYEMGMEPAVLHEFRNPDELAVILFTSGTTGRSKGVMYSESRVYAALDYYQSTVQGAASNLDTVSMLLTFPLFHIGGLNTLIVFLYTGMTITLNATMKYLYRDLEASKCNYLAVSPMIAELMVKDYKRGRQDRWKWVKVVVFASATMPSATMSFLRDQNILVQNAYGQTESCGNITLNTGINPEKDASVGTIGPFKELRIQDGEICLKSKTNMMGYYHDEEATREALQNGWLHTGDLGYMDEDGYVYITGRKKNLMVMSGGENVSPEELERMLMKCEAIKEVLVHQMDAHICATIFCREQDQEMIDQYIDSMNREVPLYKRITRVYYTGHELPKTATNKIKRY